MTEMDEDFALEWRNILGCEFPLEFHPKHGYEGDGIVVNNGSRMNDETKGNSITSSSVVRRISS